MIKKDNDGYMNIVLLSIALIVVLIVTIIVIMV